MADKLSNSLSEAIAKKVELLYTSVTGTTSATYGFFDLGLSSVTYEVLAVRCTGTPVIAGISANNSWIVIPVGTASGDTNLHIFKNQEFTVEVVYCRRTAT